MPFTCLPAAFRDEELLGAYVPEELGEEDLEEASDDPGDSRILWMPIHWPRSRARRRPRESHD